MVVSANSDRTLPPPLAGIRRLGTWRNLTSQDPPPIAGRRSTGTASAQTCRLGVRFWLVHFLAPGEHVHDPSASAAAAELPTCTAGSTVCQGRWWCFADALVVEKAVLHESFPPSFWLPGIVSTIALVRFGSVSPLSTRSFCALVVRPRNFTVFSPFVSADLAFACTRC